jgi:thymidylate synthase
MNWHADSYHIYGKDIENAKQLLFDRIDKIDFEDRTFNFRDDFIQEMYNDAEKVVTAKIHEYDSTH